MLLKTLLCRLLTSRHRDLEGDFALPESQGGFPFRNKTRSPRVRRVSFLPCIRCIYFHRYSWSLGFRMLGPFALDGCLICTFCTSDQEFAYSFLQPRPRDLNVAVRLMVPYMIGPFRTYMGYNSSHVHLRENASCLAHQTRWKRIPITPEALLCNMQKYPVVQLFP